jgi:hypothetical protein
VENHPTSNLLNYGVFITNKPFDAEYLPDIKQQKLERAKGAAIEQFTQEWLIPKHEQRKLIQEAQGKLIGVLQQRILEADNWYMAGGQQRAFINDWHRLCLKAFNQITNRKETKPWAGIPTEDVMISCVFCGHAQRPGLPICGSCHYIIDQELFDKLKPKKAE